MIADVVVVGAGPAGAATATHLARAGLHVLLLDRADFPRAKPCGDCISAGAAPLLEHLGVLEDLRALGPARLDGWRIRAPGGAALAVPFGPEESALSIERARLDALLLDAARAAGARARLGVRATDLLRDRAGAVCGVTTTHGPIRARLTVAADGLRSTLARRAGLARLREPRKASVTAHVRGLRDADAWGEIHLERGATVGIAPVEAGNGGRLFNVTLVLADGARAPRTPREFLRAVAAVGGLTPRVRDALVEASGGRALLASGPFSWRMHRLVLPGFALAGDAAGYFDPLTGQGVLHALASAELLAGHAADALRASAPPHLIGYERGWRARMREAHALQRAVEAVVSRPALSRALLPLLDSRRAAAHALLAAIAGLTAPRALLSIGVAASLLLPSNRQVAS